MAPGNAWVNQGRGIGQGYYFNTTVDEVRIWTVASAQPDGELEMIQTAASYPAAVLFKQITTDEHNKQII